MLRRAWHCSVTHILREENSSADFLAKKGATSQDQLVISTEPPSGMQQLLIEDAMGVKFVTR